MPAARTVDPKKLLEARARRFTREDLAHRLRDRGHATSAKTIWRWEKGHNQPGGAILGDLADVLGVSVDSLYGRQR